MLGVLFAQVGIDTILPNSSAILYINADPTP